MRLVEHDVMLDPLVVRASPGSDLGRTVALGPDLGFIDQSSSRKNFPRGAQHTTKEGAAQRNLKAK